MTKIQEKAAFVANELSMANCPCPQPTIEAILTDVYALFAAQVPSGQPSAQQDTDTMARLSNPGLLDRLRLRRIVKQHAGRADVAAIHSALLDLGKTLTLSDTRTALMEGRQANQGSKP